MKSYVLRSSQFTGSITLGFDKAGVMRQLKNDAELSDTQFTYLLTTLPKNLTDLPRLIGDSKTLTVTPLSDDLTFETFYNAYGRKVGNKERVQKLWNKLSDIDKQTALDAIVSYDYYLMCNPTIVKLYPETYLAQRRFENDFRALTAAPKR